MSDTPNDNPQAGTQPEQTAGSGTAPAPAGNGKRRRVILPVLILGILALGAVAYYFYYEGANFVSSEDANVTGNVVYIYPPTAGILENWNAHLSQYVTENSVLGTIRAPVDATAVSPASGSPGPQLGGVPVTASVSGVIIQNDGVPGEQVNPALDLPLAAEVDLRTLWVQANIDETEIGRIQVGQRVDVTVDALPGRKLVGRVEAIESATQSTFALIPASDTSGTFTKVTQRIPVKIALTNTVGLAPGMSAEVRIHLH